MRKIVTISILIAALMTSAPIFAADGKGAFCPNPTCQAAQPCQTCQEEKAPAKTIFNALSDYFSMFDRPFTRKGNTQGFWNATADWMRNINKE